MAPDSREIADQPTEPDDSADPRQDWYDRSSLLGDFTVMIADQTEEDYLRRRRADRSCEYRDGVVSLPPTARDWAYETAAEARKVAGTASEVDETDQVMNDWYDRSSLVGDFLVMIADETFDDYMRRCPEGKFCEFIDGVVYMPSLVTLWHQFEIQFLSSLLEFYTGRRRAGIVLTGPAALKIRTDCMLEPDIFVIPYGDEAQFQHVYCDPPVLLVVEVLSKSTRSHDLKAKAALYREAGVIEVWFIDQRDERLIIHRQTDDSYEIETIESGLYRSQAIAGFWIEVSWLWARPRPDLLECLDAILAGPPA